MRRTRSPGRQLACNASTHGLRSIGKEERSKLIGTTESAVKGTTMSTYTFYCDFVRGRRGGGEMQPMCFSMHTQLAFTTSTYTEEPAPALQKQQVCPKRR